MLTQQGARPELPQASLTQSGSQSPDQRAALPLSTPGAECCGHKEGDQRVRRQLHFQVCTPCSTRSPLTPGAT